MDSSVTVFSNNKLRDDLEYFGQANINSCAEYKAIPCKSTYEYVDSVQNTNENKTYGFPG